MDKNRSEIKLPTLEDLLKISDDLSDYSEICKNQLFDSLLRIDSDLPNLEPPDDPELKKCSFNNINKIASNLFDIRKNLTDIANKISDLNRFLGFDPPQKRSRGMINEVLYHQSRRSGRTTRSIDQSIQLLFTNGVVWFWDHHGTRQATEDAMRRMLKRLYLEHGLECNPKWQPTVYKPWVLKITPEKNTFKIEIVKNDRTPCMFLDDELYQIAKKLPVNHWSAKTQCARNMMYAVYKYLNKNIDALRFEKNKITKRGDFVWKDNIRDTEVLFVENPRGRFIVSHQLNIDENTPDQEVIKTVKRACTHWFNAVTRLHKEGYTFIEPEGLKKYFRAEPEMKPIIEHLYGTE